MFDSYEGECVHTGFCGRRKLFGSTRHRRDENIETDILKTGYGREFNPYPASVEYKVNS